jgi:hypothetical protein
MELLATSTAGLLMSTAPRDEGPDKMEEQEKEEEEARSSGGFILYARASDRANVDLSRW